MIFKFSKPFKYGDENVTSVDLKEDFDTGDMIRIANCKGEGDKSGALLCAATRWPIGKVSKIPVKDSLKILEKVTPFFDDLLDSSEKDGSET